MNMAYANWENRGNILKLLRRRINLSGSILSNLGVQDLPKYYIYGLPLLTQLESHPLNYQIILQTDLGQGLCLC